MSGSDRIERILGFLETLDRFKSVYRAAYLTDGSRNESDAEHSWHLAMYALLLHEGTGLEVDLGRTLELILVHDLVEIYAGDTPLHGLEGHEDKQARESAAADRLFATLPTDVERAIRERWQEFENGESPEARFAGALDRLQAFAQNVFTAGRVWRHYRVTEDVSRSRNERAMNLDPSLREIFEALYERAARDRMWHEGA
ncbi:MAG: HD domain-containing protein [Actinomycetota bacterium]